MRILRTLLLAVLLLAPVPALALTRGAEPAQAGRLGNVDSELIQAIGRIRRTTAQMELVMGVRRTFPAVGKAHPSRLRMLALWRQHAAVVRHRFAAPPHAGAWQCIHRYEGSWTDAGAPYYGGLQMDIGFQSAYGSFLLRTKGTADHWTPLEQMWVAERAYRSGRGFYPWPNTARYCGLI
jgi:hypothetical protein